MLETVKNATSDKHAHDTLPPLMMVVDRDLGIHEMNDAARAFLGPRHKEALSKRSGEAFQCAHCTEAAAGCGNGRFCQICPIREAVGQAYQDQQVVRRRTRAEMGNSGNAREVHLLVTATPLPFQRAARVLLVFEDISALMELQNPTPICAYCRRIRKDDNFWEQVEDQFRRHFDLDMSHGICPDCKDQFYGNLTGRKAQRGGKRAASGRKR
jgi:hypothetical protein